MNSSRHTPWIPPATLAERCEERIHVLLWQASGTAALTIDGHERTLTPGQAQWIPAGVRHQFTVHADSVTVPLFFDAERTATTLSEPVAVTVSREMHTLLLAHSVSSTSQIVPAANLARQVLGLIETSTDPEGALPLPEQEPARSVAQALRINPGDTRTAGELAASAHASLRTLERSFLAQTGMTLRQWRIRSRMQAAARLLTRGMAVEAVAHRVGYTHVNAFRRVFKEHHGISASEHLRGRGSVSSG